MKTMPEPQQLHVSVRHEDGAFWATVDEYPGVFATGDDLDELRESLQEGIALILALARPGEGPPAVTVGAFAPGARRDERWRRARLRLTSSSSSESPGRFAAAPVTIAAWSGRGGTSS
jgi:predicted RNase H-like HicB family nuclease